MFDVSDSSAVPPLLVLLILGMCIGRGFVNVYHGHTVPDPVVKEGLFSLSPEVVD